MSAETSTVALASSIFAPVPCRGMSSTPERNFFEAHGRRSERVFLVVYLGGGEYALDLALGRTPPFRLAKARSLEGIRRRIARFARPGDVVYQSEVLGAMQRLTLPQERRTLLAAALDGDLFAHIGGLEMVPDAERSDRRGGTAADPSRSTSARSRTMRGSATPSHGVPRHRLEWMLPPDDQTPPSAPESLN